jgi:hypothetical protein
MATEITDMEEERRWLERGTKAGFASLRLRFFGEGKRIGEKAGGERKKCSCLFPNLHKSFSQLHI